MEALDQSTKNYCRQITNETIYDNIAAGFKEALAVRAKVSTMNIFAPGETRPVVQRICDRFLKFFVAYRDVVHFEVIS